MAHQLVLQISTAQTGKSAEQRRIQLEREYRWLIKGETDEPIYVPVDGAIQAIIVGERFQMNYLPSLYPFTEKLNFLILKCFWNNGDPMLSPDYSASVPSL